MAAIADVSTRHLRLLGPLSLAGLVGLALGAVIPFLSLQDLTITLVVLVHLLGLLVLYTCSGRQILLTPASLFLGIVYLVLSFGALELFLTEKAVLPIAHISVGVLSFVTGVAVASVLSNFHPRKEFPNYVGRPWGKEWHTGDFRLGLAGLISSTFLVGFIYFYLNGIPILADDVEVARVTASRTYGYLYRAFTHGIFFAVAVVTVIALQRGGKWHTVAATLIIIASFTLIGIGFRGPLGRLLFTFLVAWQLFRHRLPWTKIGLLGLVLAAVFVLLTWQRYSLGFVDRTLADLPVYAYTAIERRLILRNAEIFQFIVDYIPAQHEFLLGRSYVMDLKATRPGPDLSFGGWLTSIWRPRLAGVAGATPTIVGEMYANFAVAGIVLGMFAIGLLLQGLFILLIRTRKRVDRASLYVVLTAAIPWLVTKGLGSFVLVDLLPFLILFLVLQAMSNWRGSVPHSVNSPSILNGRT